MQKIKSLSDKRLIVQATLNGKPASFLLDTGASVGLIDRDIRKKYGLVRGRAFPHTLVGAGGEFTAYYCNTFAYLHGRALSQFLLADIRSVVESIKQQTGIEIQGIISLPQMQFARISLDADDSLIILE